MWRESTRKSDSKRQWPTAENLIGEKMRKIKKPYWTIINPKGHIGMYRFWKRAYGVNGAWLSLFLTYDKSHKVLESEGWRVVKCWLGVEE